MNQKASLPWVATMMIALATAGITVVLMSLRHPPHVNKEAGKPKNEDPLALYQVARELHSQGEQTAALQMVERARQVTQHSRAHKLLDELEEEIKQAASGKRVANGDSRGPHPLGRSVGEDRGPSVYVESDAIGEIRVDGQPTGARTPALLDLPAGWHTIEVVPLLDPSEAMTRSVQVRPGKTIHLKMTLPPDSAQPTVPDTNADPATGSQPVEVRSADTDPAPGTKGASNPSSSADGGTKPHVDHDERPARFLSR